MDVHSGQILAMASYPTYDPKVWVGGISRKNYKKLAAKGANYPVRPPDPGGGRRGLYVQGRRRRRRSRGRRDHAFHHVLLRRHVQDSQHRDNIVWHCWLPSGHGSISLIPAIAQSCDVYFYNVGYQFYLRQGTALEDWATRLGLGSPTGIDIPGEAERARADAQVEGALLQDGGGQDLEAGRLDQLAIGQGNMEATPLQLATTYAAIANGGTIVQPHLGLRVVDAQGQLVRDLQPPQSHKVDISQSTLNVVRAGLRDAASLPGGSAPVFASYQIASPARPARPRCTSSRKANVTTPGTRATRRPATPSTSSSS